ncbi:MAG TPA: hypothetical protein VGO93_02780 [Candidatus Xenobia bacterium]|jgi:hypothetical protein
MMIGCNPWSFQMRHPFLSALGGAASMATGACMGMGMMGMGMGMCSPFGFGGFGGFGGGCFGQPFFNPCGFGMGNMFGNGFSCGIPPFFI